MEPHKTNEVYTFYIPPNSNTLVYSEIMSESESRDDLPIVDPSLLKQIEDFSICSNSAKPIEYPTIDEYVSSYTLMTTFEMRDYIEKLGILRNLHNITKNVGTDKAIVAIIPLIISICKCKFVELKVELLIQLPDLISILNYNNTCYKLIIEKILPIVKILHSDTQVKGHTGRSLFEIAKILNEEDRGIYILAYILQLSHDDDILNRIEAVSLLNLLAPMLGMRYCEQYIIHDINYIISEENTQFTKFICQNMLKICETISTNAFEEKLFPTYKSLLTHRHTCIKRESLKIIVSIHKLCNLNKKIELLTIFECLLKDRNENTTCLARRYIGPLIIISSPSIINLPLLHEFTKLPSQSESDLLLCTQYLPAVLHFMGTQSWEILKSAFKVITSSKLENIKEILASSLHEYFAYLPYKHYNELMFQYACLSKEKSKQLIRLYNEYIASLLCHLPAYRPR